MNIGQARAVRALARHDGDARVSDRTSVRSGLVEWSALRALLDEGLACHTGDTQFGLTDSGRRIAAELRTPS